MSRNDILNVVQRGIRAVKSRQMSVSMIGDAIQSNQCLVLTEIKGCQVRDWTVGE